MSGLARWPRRLKVRHLLGEILAGIANANANLPGQPAMVDQPFGSGHAIMLGFDPWYRAWTMQEERLVLSAVLYPAGAAIPPGTQNSPH
jgi:hypothetical protein